MLRHDACKSMIRFCEGCYVRMDSIMCGRFRSEKNELVKVFTYGYENVHKVKKYRK